VTGSTFDAGIHWEIQKTKGDWKTETAYYKGDFVKYNNNLYKCKMGYVSEAFFNPLKWDLITIANVWVSNTTYHAGDYVNYGGNVCCYKFWWRVFVRISQLDKYSWMKTKCPEYSNVNKVSYNSKMYECLAGYISEPDYFHGKN